MTFALEKGLSELLHSKMVYGIVCFVVWDYSSVG